MHDPQNADEQFLMGFAAGWLVGYERGVLEGYERGAGDHEAIWAPVLRQAARISERAGHAKAWRDAVLRGEHPRDAAYPMPGPVTS